MVLGTRCTRTGTVVCGYTLWGLLRRGSGLRVGWVRLGLRRVLVVLWGRVVWGWHGGRVLRLRNGARRTTGTAPGFMPLTRVFSASLGICGSSVLSWRRKVEVLDGRQPNRVLHRSRERVRGVVCRVRGGHDS